MAEAPAPASPNQFNTTPMPITCDYPRRQLVMYQVTGDELDQLGQNSTSLNWVLFGTCFGGLGSFASVLLSTPVPSVYTFATFASLTVVFAILSVFFGVNGYRDYDAAKRKIAAIKRGGGS